MNILPGPHRLPSGKLSRNALHSVLGAALLTAASIDCGKIGQPENHNPEYVMAVASNLAISRIVNPDIAWLYEIILADYIRFFKLYLEGTVQDDINLRKEMQRSFLHAIRKAYKDRKRELFDVRSLIDLHDGIQ